MHWAVRGAVVELDRHRAGWFHLLRLEAHVQAEGLAEVPRGAEGPGHHAAVLQADDGHETALTDGRLRNREAGERGVAQAPRARHLRGFDSAAIDHRRALQPHVFHGVLLRQRQRGGDGDGALVIEARLQKVSRGRVGPRQAELLAGPRCTVARVSVLRQENLKLHALRTATMLFDVLVVRRRVRQRVAALLVVRGHEYFREEGAVVRKRRARKRQPRDHFSGL
mmetsp:Transcript_27043/g.75410  ORF Transcript_27043/g.75410 Transcript_27043/m.75410 type:complete len:224 (-) Transcript_27043:1372-2043(-)